MGSDKKQFPNLNKSNSNNDSSGKEEENNRGK